MATTSERSDTVALPNITELFEYNPDTVTTFAALHRISAEVLPLALAGLPYGTRQWADDLGLIGAMRQCGRLRTKPPGVSRSRESSRCE